MTSKWPLNDLKMTFKLKNNYRFLKHKLPAFQWYITCHDIRKLIFCHFLMYASFKNGSKSGLVVQRVQKSVKNRFSNRFPIVCVLGGWWLIFRGGVSFLDHWLLIGEVERAIYPCWRLVDWPLVSSFFDETQNWKVGISLNRGVQELSKKPKSTSAHALEWFLETNAQWKISLAVSLQIVFEK